MPDLFVSLVALIQLLACQQLSPGCDCSRRWRFCDCGDGNKCVHSSQHSSDRARYAFSADSNVWTPASKNVLIVCLFCQWSIVCVLLLTHQQVMRHGLLLQSMLTAPRSGAMKRMSVLSQLPHQIWRQKLQSQRQSASPAQKYQPRWSDLSSFIRSSILIIAL